MRLYRVTRTTQGWLPPGMESVWLVDAVALSRTGQDDALSTPISTPDNMEIPVGLVFGVPDGINWITIPIER